MLGDNSDMGWGSHVPSPHVTWLAWQVAKMGHVTSTMPHSCHVTWQPPNVRDVTSFLNLFYKTGCYERVKYGSQQEVGTQINLWSKKSNCSLTKVGDKHVTPVSFQLQGKHRPTYVWLPFRPINEIPTAPSLTKVFSKGNVLWTLQQFLNFKHISLFLTLNLTTPARSKILKLQLATDLQVILSCQHH